MSNRMREEAIGIVSKLWQHFNLREWDDARKLLADGFEAHWPQSREKIVGAENFIAINRQYPGKGSIQVEGTRWGYDPQKQVHQVTTRVRIRWEKEVGGQEELFAISFFELNGELRITKAVEYWAETYPAPEWRRKYVEIVD